MLTIVNKKAFARFIVVSLLFIGALFFMIFKVINFKGNTLSVEQNKPLEKNVEGILNKPNDVVRQDLEAVQSQAIPQPYIEYNNQQYGYTVAFPSTWYLNTDSSETKLTLANIEEKNINSGGQTFWSNYKNINDYSPEQKPEDFRLLGLIIYEAQGMSTDDLAMALGFDQEAILQKTAFRGNDVSGTEYVAASVDEKNPQVMIILQKEQRFYVFNLGFINGDVQAAEVMEGIAKTFSLKE